MQSRNNKHRVQYRDSTGRVKSATFTRKADAIAFVAKVERERTLIRQGLDLPKESKLVLDYAGRHLRRRALEIEASTFAAEERNIKWFVERLGIKTVRSVTTKDVRDMLDELQIEKKWSNATRNRARAYIHIFFEHALEDEEIMFNPVSRLPALQENPAKKIPLTPEEVRAMIAAADSPERILFVCLLAYQGPRVSEAVGLDHGDFDLNHGYLSFRQTVEQETGILKERLKGKVEGIVVPLVPIVRSAYLNHVAALRRKPLPSDPVFLKLGGKERANTHTGQSWIRTLARHAVMGHEVNRRGKKVPIKISKKVSPHVLRATFASLAEEAGMSREVIQKLMGHSSLAVTGRYVSRRDTQIQSVVFGSGFGQDLGNAKVVDIKEKRK